MIHGSEARAYFNRRVVFNGEAQLDTINKNGYFLPCSTIDEHQSATVTIDDAQVGSVGGGTYYLKTDTNIQVTKALLAVRPHPKLYELGVVSCVPYIAEEDGPVQIEVRVETDESVDLTAIPYLAKVYMI